MYIYIYMCVYYLSVYIFLSIYIYLFVYSNSFVHIYFLCLFFVFCLFCFFFIYLFIYVCVYVCVYVCMYECMYLFIYVCMRVCVPIPVKILDIWVSTIPFFQYFVPFSLLEGPLSLCSVSCTSDKNVSARQRSSTILTVTHIYSNEWVQLSKTHMACVLVPRRGGRRFGFEAGLAPANFQVKKMTPMFSINIFIFRHAHTTQFKVWPSSLSRTLRLLAPLDRASRWWPLKQGLG